MKKQALLLLSCFILTLLLALLDRDVTSFGSLVRWENVPALVLYTLFFRLMIAGVTRASRAFSASTRSVDPG